MSDVYSTLCSTLGVSRETGERLEAYVALLKRWQKAKNLVAQSTLEAVWQRHVADSLQLALHADLDHKKIVDMGSGAGFPGLVLAIYAAHRAPQAEFTLIESNHKKCAFLREAARHAGLANLRIIDRRIEDAEAAPADIVTARALAPLPKLMDWSAPFLKAKGCLLLLKGRSTDDELAEAERGWCYNLERHQSLTDAEASVLLIHDIEPRSVAFDVNNS